MRQLSSPCAVCGAPADDAHHYHEHDLAHGKGMGGTHEHVETLPLCREHHERLHQRRIYLELADDGTVRTRDRVGKLVAERPTRYRDEEVMETLSGAGGAGGASAFLSRLAQNVPYVSEAVLAALWEYGDTVGRAGMAVQALVAWQLRRMHGSYGGAWHERAAETIRAHTGTMISRSTVYDRYALAIALEACGWDLDVLRNLGSQVMVAVGKAAEPRLALERAQELRDSGTMTLTEISEVVNRKSNSLDSPCDEGYHVWACRKCGRRL